MCESLCQNIVLILALKCNKLPTATLNAFIVCEILYVFYKLFSTKFSCVELLLYNERGHWPIPCHDWLEYVPSLGFAIFLPKFLCQICFVVNYNLLILYKQCPLCLFLRKENVLNQFVLYLLVYCFLICFSNCEIK